MARRREKISVQTFEEVLQRVLEEDKATDWKLAKKFQHTDMWRKSEDDSAIHVFKCVSKLTGVPCSDAVKLVTDYELRTRYDRTFNEIKVLEDCGHYKTVYWFSQFPTPASDRDLVLHCWVKTDEATKTTYIIGINGDHKNAPSKLKVVRAESKLSGVIIRPDEEDINSSVIVTISQTDMKGLIPSFIVSGAFVKSGDSWRESIVNFYHKRYSKEKQLQ